MQTQHDSRGNRFGLVLLLAILLFAIVGFALYTNKGDDGQSAMMMKKQKDAASGEELPMPMEPGPSILAGTVVEIRNMEGSGGKGIKISVSTPEYKDGKVPGPEQTEAVVLPSKTTEYAFFISDKDTEGGKDLKGGEFVTIYFQGEPSEKMDVLAKNVEVAK